MKILYDHQIFASQEYGGISRYFVELGSRLATLPGVSVEVLCPLYVNAFLAEAPMRVHGKRVHRLRSSARAMRLLNAMLSPGFKAARAGTTVYHETYFSRLDLAPRGASNVVTVHDMVHEKFPSSFSRLDTIKLAKRVAITRADHVICVSENTRNDLLESFQLDSSRVSVVYHGSSLTASSASSNTPRQSHLLFVGGRSGYKNFAALVEAFASSRLPSDGFKIKCFGGGQFSAEELAQFSRLGVQDNFVHVAGNDRKLEELLATSAALVYPSLYEGFGIPPLEAMSCGCPVICSNSSSLPEVVGNAAQMFDPTDVEEIRSAIESVALSSARATELTEAGFTQAAKFSWDRSAKETLAVYKLVGG